jgi:hypothetical protein
LKIGLVKNILNDSNPEIMIGNTQMNDAMVRPSSNTFSNGSEPPVEVFWVPISGRIQE